LPNHWTSPVAHRRTVRTNWVPPPAFNSLIGRLHDSLMPDRADQPADPASAACRHASARWPAAPPGRAIFPPAWPATVQQLTVSINHVGSRRPPPTSRH
jgi:hypothetical protein